MWHEHDNRKSTMYDLYCCLLPQCGFAHLSLGISNRNKVVLWPGCELRARYNLHKKNVRSVRFLQIIGDVFTTFHLALYWMCDSPRTGCARRATHEYMWCEQAV